VLPGVFRGRLVEEGKVEEGVVRVAELARAEGVWLISSVRGWRRVELVG